MQEYILAMAGRTALLVLAIVAVSGRPASLQSQDNTATLAELETRARVDSNDPVAHYNYAAALAKKGRYGDAERPLRIAVRIDPQYAPALMLLARVNESRYVPFGVMPRGRHLYFVRLDERADETALLRRRAFLIDPLVEIGTPGRQALPVKWRETLGRAMRAYEAERWSEASAGFQSVIDRTVRPSDSTKVPPVVLWYRARCALKVGNFDDAIRHLEWLLALRMQDSASEQVWNPFAGEELRYVLAYVHQMAGRWDDAVTRYQELLQVNLGLDPAHSHIAEIYGAEGRWTEAVIERVRAIQANPDATSLYFNLGATLTAAGRYEEALAALQKYVGSYPRESRAFYLMGVGHMGLGHPDSARVAFAQFLAMAPSRYGEQIDDTRRRLNTLGP